MPIRPSTHSSVSMVPTAVSTTVLAAEQLVRSMGLSLTELKQCEERERPGGLTVLLPLRKKENAPFLSKSTQVLYLFSENIILKQCQNLNQAEFVWGKRMNGHRGRPPSFAVSFVPEKEETVFDFVSGASKPGP